MIGRRPESLLITGSSFLQAVQAISAGVNAPLQKKLGGQIGFICKSRLILLAIGLKPDHRSVDGAFSAIALVWLYL